MYQPPRQFNMPRIRCARMRFYLRNSRVLCLGPLPLPPTYIRSECALLPFFFLPCCPLTRDTCATAIVCMHLIQPIGHVEHVIFDPTHWSANKLSLFARSSLRIACKYLILLWYQLLPYSRVYLHIYFYKKGYTYNCNTLFPAANRFEICDRIDSFY